MLEGKNANSNTTVDNNLTEGDVSEYQQLKKDPKFLEFLSVVNRKETGVWANDMEMAAGQVWPVSMSMAGGVGGVLCNVLNRSTALIRMCYCPMWLSSSIFRSVTCHRRTRRGRRRTRS